MAKATLPASLLEAMDCMNNNASDMPDGAWQQMMQDEVHLYNVEHGTNFDPYDAFIEWVEQNSET